MTTTIQQAGRVPATVESRINEYNNSSSVISSYNSIAFTSKTFRDVLTSDHLTIGDIAARGNRGWVCAYISAGIVSYLEYLGRHNTMTDDMIKETAGLLLDEFPRLKVDDVALFFRLCKTAHFGHLYDINGAALFEWLRLYVAERHEAEIAWEDERAAQRRAEMFAPDTRTPEERDEDMKHIDGIIQRVCGRMGRERAKNRRSLIETKIDKI